MPMSPEVMSALKQVKPGGAAGVPKQGGTGPAAANMMTQQQPSGALMKSKLQMQVCVKLLEQAMMGAGGALSEEGKACMKAIQTLAKVIGKQEGDSENLMPMEQKVVAGGMSPGGPPGAGGAAPPPGAGGPPGAAPPGMPPPGAGAAPPMAA
jgi:hypothetical protein